MRRILQVTLRRKFMSLRNAMQSLDTTLRRLRFANGTAEVVSNGRPLRRARLTPKARAALVLQGLYMGYMRQLKPKQKAQVRSLKVSRGVQAAIKRARRLASA